MAMLTPFLLIVSVIIRFGSTNGKYDGMLLNVVCVCRVIQYAPVAGFRSVLHLSCDRKQSCN